MRREPRLRRWLGTAPFVSLREDLGELVTSFLGETDGGERAWISPALDLSETEAAIEVRMDRKRFTNPIPVSPRCSARRNRRGDAGIKNGGYLAF